MDANSLMQAIKEFRESLGWTQVQLSTKLNKSYSSIQRYETKEPPPPADFARMAFIARDAKRPKYAKIFRDAALASVPREIVQLIAEWNGDGPEEAPSPSHVDRKKVRI